MADVYQMPNATHMEGIDGMFSYIQLVSEGIFMPMMLIAIWFISAITSIGGSRLEVWSGFIVASVITTVLAAPLAIAGFLNPKIMWIAVILLGISVAGKILSDGR